MPKEEENGESSNQGGYRSTPYTTSAQISSAQTAACGGMQSQQVMPGQQQATYGQQDVGWQSSPIGQQNMQGFQDTELQDQDDSAMLTEVEMAWWQEQTSMYPGSATQSQTQKLQQRMPGLQATVWTRDGQRMVKGRSRKQMLSAI
ncbi:hypothetical protein DL98DRAFT_535314 [Cadophora sp. DSE1049]|nr:hypothetical protein DL98DRAFT_535314 [Cadophora sp. DSE1049]